MKSYLLLSLFLILSCPFETFALDCSLSKLNERETKINAHKVEINKRCLKTSNGEIKARTTGDRYDCKSNASIYARNVSSLQRDQKECSSAPKTAAPAASISVKKAPDAKNTKAANPAPKKLNCEELKDSIFGTDSSPGLAKKILEARIDEGFLKFSYMYLAIARKAANSLKDSQKNTPLSTIPDETLKTKILEILKTNYSNAGSDNILKVNELFSQLMQVEPISLTGKNQEEQLNLFNAIRSVSSQFKSPEYRLSNTDQYIFTKIMIESLNNPTVSNSSTNVKSSVFDEVLKRFNEDVLFSSFEDNGVVNGGKQGGVAKAMIKNRKDYESSKQALISNIKKYLRECTQNPNFSKNETCFNAILKTLNSQDEETFTKLLHQITSDNLAMPGMRKLLSIESKPDRFRRCQFTNNNSLNANIDLTEVDESIVRPKNGLTFLGYRYILVPKAKGEFKTTLNLSVTPKNCRGSVDIVKCDTSSLTKLGDIIPFESGNQKIDAYLKNRNFNLNLPDLTKDNLSNYSFIILREYKNSKNENFYSNPDVVSLQACIEKTEKSAPAPEPVAEATEPSEAEPSCKLAQPEKDSLVKISNECKYVCREATLDDIGIISYELETTQKDSNGNIFLGAITSPSALIKSQTEQIFYSSTPPSLSRSSLIPNCRPVCDSDNHYFLSDGKCTLCNPKTHELKDNNCTPKPADKPAEDKPAEKPVPKPDEKPKDSGECKEAITIVGAASDKKSCEKYDNDEEGIFYQYDKKKDQCCPQKFFSPMTPTNRPASPQPMKGIMDNNGGAKLVL